MKVKIVLKSLAACLAILGLIFIVAGANPLLAGRIVVGSIMLAGAIALFLAARMKQEVKQIKVTERIEIGGDVSLERIKCQSCGGNIGKENVTFKDGAIFIECPYCSATYQMEESPKW